MNLKFLCNFQSLQKADTKKHTADFEVVLTEMTQKHSKDGGVVTETVVSRAPQTIVPHNF